MASKSVVDHCSVFSNESFNHGKFSCVLSAFLFSYIISGPAGHQFVFSVFYNVTFCPRHLSQIAINIYRCERYVESLMYFTIDFSFLGTMF
jgi:hypothetical protein